MKYYGFTKRAFVSRFFSGLGNALCYLIVPGLIFFIVWVWLSKLIKDFELSPLMIIICCSACLIISIGLFVYHLFSLKGVFLFDDYMEIKNGKISCLKYKRISYSDIVKVEYVESIKKYKRSMSSTDFLGGNKKGCLRMYIAGEGSIFFSIENSLDFIKEINSRIYK
ncbi:MAG: hypothetical protein ACLUFN_07255 [Eubacterium sp.]